MIARSKDKTGPRVLVWDGWTRAFHWSLVVATTVAASTGFLADATWIRLHVAGGLIAGGLVLARIVWGFLGPAPARFAGFVPHPRAVLDHLRGTAQGRHLGHNPLGALMVLALIAAILGLAVSGIAVLGGLLRSGPLAHDLVVAQGFVLGKAHQVLAFGLLGLVVLHVAGVIVESRRSHENLARAMVTGRKDRRPGDHLPRAVRVQGGLALALIALTGAGLAGANATLSARAVPGLPDSATDPVYAEECGACHMAYHPSLMPARSWTALIAGLDDHFGENASLDPATAAGINAWLTARAAETVETRPAVALARALAPDNQVAAISITGSQFWKRTHAGLSDAVFAARPVSTRSNCAACHADAASGLFSPFAIAIPKETSR